VTRFGYTMMCEQARPDQLVRDVRLAEAAGFDFSVISDHYAPWLESQGHSGYAWSILGAAAAVTERIPLMTYVTCPILRYHPAVVAQKAATLQILAEGHFTLGLGAGESLNEHVVGDWPGVATRHEMLVEAVEIIRALHTGELVDYRGDHFEVDSARVWDMPDDGVEIGVAVSGDRSVEAFAPLADHLIAVEPDAAIIDAWNAEEGATAVGPSGAKAIGQVPICWDPDEDAARKRAHEQFRWFAGGWPVNADLPTPAGFEAASQFVTPDDVADQIPCGPDLDAIAEAVLAFPKAGFTDVAVVQIGDQGQERFVAEAAGPLLERLRAAG
jgi:G6PDH family F420-dependent oxidoreductase